MAAFTPRRLLEALQRLPASQRYWLAYSGGRDSHVLLHALASLRQALVADIQVVHVDHGLSPQSEQWRQHCQSVSAELNLPFIHCHVDARPAAGQSPEAAARQARYTVLAELLAAGDVLLTGQHQDDQAETLMLQLLRGAGPHGLAAMPAYKPFASGYLVRPLLAFPRAKLDDYARAHGLQWIDDPSNDDHRFKRNYLRHEVMPRLNAQWPAFARTLSRSASLCADAAELLDQLAAQDVTDLAMDGGLSVSGLQALDAVRQRNVLRYWCGSKGLPLPFEAHIHQIQRQMSSPADSLPLICWPGVELRRYRDCLMIMPPLPLLDARMEVEWDMSAALELPHGRLELQPAQVPGPAVARNDVLITVRLRRGGERLRMASGQHQMLKKFLQQQAVVPWQRDRLPLIYINGELAAVAGLWCCDDFSARLGRSSLTLAWFPSD